MIYDENEDSEVIDLRYVKDQSVTRYKLVCESDVDNLSLPKKDQSLVDEFIEIGLKSTTKVEVIQEVQILLLNFASQTQGHPPQTDFEVLLDRILRLSGPNGRPLETVIQEHLVGTSVQDPVIQQLEP